MTQPAPIYARESTAAKLLDMKTREFLALVSDGVLPRPVKIGPHDRWDAEELRAICRGERPDGFDDVKW